MKEKLPILTILIGILLWVPNIVLGEAYFYWLLTPIIGGIGAYLSYRGGRIFLMVLNLLIACSFAIVMFFGTLLLGP